MRITLSTFAVVVGLGLLPAPALLQEKGGDDVTGPYNVAQKWPLPLSVAKPGSPGMTQPPSSVRI